MDRPMGQVRQLDILMNERGYLRLMTSDSLMRNMSNTLPDDLKTQTEKDQPKKSVVKSEKGIFYIPLVKKVLMRLYNKIFSIYYRK